MIVPERKVTVLEPVEGWVMQVPLFGAGERLKLLLQIVLRRGERLKSLLQIVTTDCYYKLFLDACLAYWP